MKIQKYTRQSRYHYWKNKKYIYKFNVMSEIIKYIMTETYKKLYKFICDGNTEELNKEVTSLGYQNSDVIDMLRGIHAAWTDTNRDCKDAYYHYAKIAYDSANSGDVTSINDAGVLDCLWLMFYISDDLKYPAAVRSVYHSDSCPSVIRCAASWSYDSHYRRPDDYGIVPIPRLADDEENTSNNSDEVKTVGCTPADHDNSL